MNTKQCNTYVNNKFALANILESFLLGDTDFHQGQLEDLERFYEDQMSEDEANWYDNEKKGTIPYYLRRDIKELGFLQYTECVEAIKVLEQISETYWRNPPVEFLRLKYLLNLTNIKY